MCDRGCWGESHSTACAVSNLLFAERDCQVNAHHHVPVCM